jgi:hypothetical protein
MSDKDFEDMELSDEELEALDGDEGEGTEPEEEPEGTEEIKDEGEDIKDPAEGTPVAEEEPEGEPEPERADKPFVPSFNQIDPTDLTAIRDEVSNLKKQFDEGEVEYDIYMEKRLELKEMETAAKLRAEFNQEMVQKNWEWEQNRFLDENPVIREDKRLFRAFAGEVNEILESADAANMSGRQILSKAKGSIDDLISIVQGKGTETQPKEKSPKDTEKEDLTRDAKKKQADRSNIPKTLSNVPPAALNDDGGEFAHLDKLSGDKLEDALERMSNAELKRYADTH